MLCDYIIESFETMAVQNEKAYTANEVLQLLEQNKECEDAVGNLICITDMDAESEDEDSPEDDGTLADGSTMLVPAEY